MEAQSFRLTDAQAQAIMDHIEGFVHCLRQDTMDKLVRLGLVGPHGDGHSGRLTPLGYWVEETIIKSGGKRRSFS
jgi:hypothetical protein